MTKDQFYFQGKYFDNEAEFLKYAHDWLKFPLDQKTADRQINTLKKEIIMNIFLNGIKFNNEEFQQYINKIFEFAVNQLPGWEPPLKRIDHPDGTVTYPPLEPIKTIGKKV